MTEELRIEDGINGLSLNPDGSVTVSARADYSYGDDALRHAAAALLTEAGYPAARIDVVHDEVSPQAQLAVEVANARLQQIHSRLTEELRIEDGITRLVLNDDASVTVVAGPHASYDDAALTHAARELLDHPLFTSTDIHIVRPAIEPIVPPFMSAHVAVSKANEKLEQIHNRLTEELRAEDGISNLAVNDYGEISVVVRPHNMFSDDALRSVATELLSQAGYDATELTLVRPAIEPVPPQVGAQASVDAANAAIKQVQQRMTEELRAEDHMVNLSLRDDGSVAVVLSPHANFSDSAYLHTAKEHLENAGLVGAELTIVRPAIEPRPRFTAFEGMPS